MKLIIKGNPLIVKRKETNIDKIKAMIWLFVSDEKKQPFKRKEASLNA